MWRRGFVRRWGWIPSRRCSGRRDGAGGYRGKSANFRVSDRKRRLWLSFPMHKRFAIALQTVRGIAGGASGRGGPGLGNGGKPARWCGDLFASDGSETGRRQPRFSAGTSEAPTRQPRFSAGTSEAPARQPRFSASTSEAPTRQPRFSAEEAQLGLTKNTANRSRRHEGRDAKVVHDFSRHTAVLSGRERFARSHRSTTSAVFDGATPRRLKSLTTFAARQSGAHFRHAKLG